MQNSVTGNAIKRILQVVFRHLQGDFKKQGHHLHRRVEGLVHGIHFQASAWNEAREGKFTINLIVTSPTIYTQFLGRPFPSNPATALFPITKRIGELMQIPRDYWWSVSAQTNEDLLSKEVLEMIVQYGLPFLDSYSGIRDLLQKLRRGDAVSLQSKAQIPIIRAILANEAGYEDEARQCLQEALLDTPRFATTVKAVADRLGIIL